MFATDRGRLRRERFFHRRHAEHAGAAPVTATRTPEPEIGDEHADMA